MNKPKAAQQAAHNHAFFAAMACPSAVTWTNDIQKLFTAMDISHMKAVLNIDLGDYNSVKINAVRIYSAVASGNMPPPGSGEQPWSAAWVQTFGCWVQQNCPM